MNQGRRFKFLLAYTGSPGFAGESFYLMLLPDTDSVSYRLSSDVPTCDFECCFVTKGGVEYIVERISQPF